tara:strand:- start:680 stop:1402 length:723 start_codon:yes stop_codon:yes gene_type:complete
MSTFLNLTNELLRRLNEVQIDQADFGTVKNVQALAKDAINSSIREMLQDAQEWPFALVTYEQTLTAGTGQYAFPADYSKADWDTFYVNRLTSEGNIPRKLTLLTYDQYLSDYRPVEDVNGEGGRNDPLFVYLTQESKFGVYPVPDAAYVVEYKYYKFPADLTTFSDTALVPDRFKHVVIDGAMMYMMLFRSNEQSAQLHTKKFKDGIDMMRRLILDQPVNVTSSAINRTSPSGNFKSNVF